MKAHQFVTETLGIADILGRSSGVNVVFEGNQAATDGSTVYLPSLPLDNDLNKPAVDLLRGYVDHESAHVRLTDWDVSKKFFKETEDRQQSTLKHLTNICEDMFIEREYQELYPGSKENLNAAADWVSNETLKAGIDYSKGGADAALTALLSVGRKDYGTDATREAYDQLPAKHKAWADEWKTHMDKVKSTSDSISLARAIYKHLTQDPNLEQSPEDFDPEDNDTSGLPSDAKSNLSIDKYKGDAVKEAVEELSEGKGEGKEEGKGKNSGMGDGDGDPSCVAPDPSLYKGALKPKLPYKVYSTANDTHFDTKTWGGTHEKYSKLKSEVQGEVNVLKAKLSRVLQAKEKRDWDFGREIGRLDTKRLSSAYVGNRNVYKSRTERNEIDTVVGVLVDCSGSMGGSKIEMAQKAAIILAECLERTSVSYEIIGFTNGSSQWPKDGSYYHRIEPLWTYEFKGMNKSLRQSEPKLAGITSVAMRNNTDRDAILFMGDRLKKSPKKRKILITLSDGSPACASRIIPDAPRELMAHAKLAVDEVSQYADCYGIGIYDGSVTKLYPKSKVILKVDELPNALLDIMGEAVLK